MGETATPPSTSPLNGTMRFAIIIPAHNEGNSIEEVLRSFSSEVARKLGSEILVCEDGSTDNTREVLGRLARELPLRVVTEETRLGYASGVRRGLMLAEGDVLFFSDSDGQYDPRDFWNLEKAMDGVDMVIGRKTKREESLYRIVLSRGFHILARLLFDLRLNDIDCGFRLIRQSIVNQILPEVRDLPYSFWAEFTIVAASRNVRIAEVPVSHRSRLHGNTTIYQPRSLPSIIANQLLGLLKLRSRLRKSVGVSSDQIHTNV